jgi:hypothetical protein
MPGLLYFYYLILKVQTYLTFGAGSNLYGLATSFAVGKNLVRQGCDKPLTRAMTEGLMYPPNFFDDCNIISVKERNLNSIASAGQL